MSGAVAPSILGGRSGAPRLWKELAARLHDVGFSPTDYYLLCQDLDLRLKRGQLQQELHGQLFDPWGPGEWWQLVPNADAWARWPLHVRSGKPPRRATGYVLRDGRPEPMGYACAPTGTVGTPIGD